MVWLMAALGILLILMIVIIPVRSFKKKDEELIQNRTLDYLKGKTSVSIIELVGELDLMPNQVFKALNILESKDMITNKSGKIKMTAFGEKAYDKIIKGE